jgi:hypothetical protein
MRALKNDPITLNLSTAGRKRLKPIAGFATRPLHHRSRRMIGNTGTKNEKF